MMRNQTVVHFIVFVFAVKSVVILCLQYMYFVSSFQMYVIAVIMYSKASKYFSMKNLFASNEAEIWLIDFEMSGIRRN